MGVPDTIENWIGGQRRSPGASDYFDKRSPADGNALCKVARSGESDVADAVAAAKAAQPQWAAMTPVERGDTLRAIAQAMTRRIEDIAHIVAAETGKSPKEALGETHAAIEQGMFMAGEGRRWYGKTTTSATPHKSASTIRQPVGIAGLIIAANTPIANVAWKVFPALICGNAAVLKASEDTPATADIFAEIAHDAGLPPGVLNVIHGYGVEAGAALVAHADVDMVSFTGSARVGRMVQEVAGSRLARVCLELGGKNPLIVCDDADIDHAVKWVVLSAFSNAGQRCASGSRVIVFDGVYDVFKERLIQAMGQLKVGPTDDDDLGPVINAKQLENMVSVVERAIADGAQCLAGGERLVDGGRGKGCYMAPTLIENAKPDAEISRAELFGPITCLYRVKDYAEAIALANDADYGLTACIHTRNVHRAMRFVEEIKAGVAVVNAGTYGSEPHMPFGGLKDSGTGWREPGTEALDAYTELKTVYIIHDPAKV